MTKAELEEALAQAEEANERWVAEGDRLKAKIEDLETKLEETEDELTKFKASNPEPRNLAEHYTQIDNQALLSEVEAILKKAPPMPRVVLYKRVIEELTLLVNNYKTEEVKA